MSNDIVIVSACLTGLRTRYDATDNYNDEVFKGNKTLIPVCPEQLGGLATPRPPAEIAEGDGLDVLGGKATIIDSNGTDVTENFLIGARECLKAARLVGATTAYLKERSPSCGVKTITRDGKEINGQGVLAALLKKEGFKVKGF